MKKLILTIMAGGLAATTFAHGGGGGAFEQGNILLYGVGSYTNTHGTNTNKFGVANAFSTEMDRVLNWQVSPGIGVNITDNITVGVDLGYSGSKTTYDRKAFTSTPTLSAPQVDQVKTFDYEVGPFVRYSCNLGEHFFAFGQFTAHYVRGRVANRYVTQAVGGNSFTSDDDNKGLNASFVPAVGAMLTRTLGLTFSVGGVGYEYRKYDFGPVNYANANGTAFPTAGSNFEAKRNDFVVTFGQVYNIGIQKYFGGMMHHRRGNAEPMDDTRNMDTSDDSNSETGDDNGGRRRRRNRKNDDE